MKLKILVTGGAGFIGSSLCEKLMDLGNDIIIVDNFNDFYNPSIKIKNIDNLKEKNISNKKALNVYQVDIRDTNALDGIFEKENIDLVIHLAAMAGVRPSITNPLLYSDVNINGTINILNMCVKYNIKKLIFASSSSIYGNNKKIPFSEEHIVETPISPYAMTKKSGELICYTYHHLYKMDMACLRFFTVYGPKQRPDLAIYKFTKNIFEGSKIQLYGDGTTQRDYTYIDDIIDGIVKTTNWIMEKKQVFEVFNLGESKTISLKNMIATIEKHIGKKADIEYIGLQPGDVEKTYANIEKAKRILNYNPQIEFEDGIEKFVRWYKEEYIS